MSTETLRLSSTRVDATLDFGAFAYALISPSTKPETSRRPVFLRLRPSNFEDLTVLCQQHHITLIDTIDRQLNDLAVVRTPSKRSSADLNHIIEDNLAVHGGRTSYGNWVYLPWESKIVHLLNRDDYFDVITNRNQTRSRRRSSRRFAPSESALSVCRSEARQP